MSKEDSFDIYMVAGEKDQRLLRHFLASYELFFRTKGKIFLWVWRKHEYLLRTIQLPKNLKLLYKDDIPELIEDDYRNQMYLKLIAHNYVESEWFWVADTDYIITSPLCKSDFFFMDKPYWFYCDWRSVAENTFREGSENFLDCKIPKLFLDQQQYVINKKVLKSLGEKHDILQILNGKHLTAEQAVYGYFAYQNFNSLYEWVDTPKYTKPLVSYKVNQRPPSYCELDESVKLSGLPPAKYYVFWSHWEKAEEKMIEFLIDSQISEFGEVKIPPNRNPMFRNWGKDQIDAGSFEGLDGVHLDGWLMQKAWGLLRTDHRSILRLEIMVPSPTSNDKQNKLRLILEVNSIKETKELKPGTQFLILELKKNFKNQITLEFEGGISEPNGNRTLFAKLESFRLGNENE
jgi:hypothetical protein